MCADVMGNIMMYREPEPPFEKESPVATAYLSCVFQS